MMRKMVGKRPSLVIAIGTKGPRDEGSESQTDESGESDDEQNKEKEAGTETDVRGSDGSVRCKVCDTDIDTTTGEPIEDKHNEQEAVGKVGPDFGDKATSEEGKVASKFGPAQDAANGENAITKALDLLGGRK